MFLHQSAWLDLNLYHACDPSHMHQGWNIEHREEEYVYTNILVEHLRLWMCELPYYHWVAQVAMQADVASVLVLAVWVTPVEVHLCICTTSMSWNSVLCHVGKERSHPFDFPQASPGVFPLQLSNFHPQETQLPTSPLHGLRPEVAFIRYCVSSVAVYENPPLAILAIFKARHMSDSSSWTRPPCLAIVADMLKTHKKLDAACTYQIRQLPLPKTLL